MNYPSPRALLLKHGLSPKKSWGQNFLSDPGALERIAELAAPVAGEPVLELGAGLGHLTSRLLERGARVIAVERDRDMAAVLRVELGEKVEILEADAARLDYGELADRLGLERLAVAGNLPYHLTSPILFSLLDHCERVSRAVFLLQKEVAERLSAVPGTKDFGLVSVLLQREAEVRVALHVSRQAFLPPPNVDSAVLVVRFRPPPGGPVNVKTFRALVKGGFGQRRKTLANALSASKVAPEEALKGALERSGIDPKRRGETLLVSEWEALTRALVSVSEQNGEPT